MMGARGLLAERLAELRPETWPLVRFSEWFELHQVGIIMSADADAYPPIARALMDWWEGKANDHMTVLRLHKLMGVAA